MSPRSYGRKDIDALLECIERMRLIARAEADGLEAALRRGSTTLTAGRLRHVCREIMDVDAVVEGYLE